jgi:hypothetical protein
MNLECFVEDLFLGGQWSIILGYRRLSVKSLLVHNLFEGLELSFHYHSSFSSAFLFYDPFFIYYLNMKKMNVMNHWVETAAGRY